MLIGGYRILGSVTPRNVQEENCAGLAMSNCLGSRASLQVLYSGKCYESLHPSLIPPALMDKKR